MDVTMVPGQLKGELDASYYVDPGKLLNATPVSDPLVAFSVFGNQLTITPPSGFVGSFLVEALISDGAVTASQKFKVTVTG
jgi:hypothetical protein